MWRGGREFSNPRSGSRQCVSGSEGAGACCACTGVQRWGARCRADGWLSLGLTSQDAWAGGGEPALWGHMKVLLNKEVGCVLLCELTPFFSPFFFFSFLNYFLTPYIAYFTVNFVEFRGWLSVRLICCCDMPFSDVTGSEAWGWHTHPWVGILPLNPFPSSLRLRKRQATPKLCCFDFSVESVHLQSSSAWQG